MVCLCAAWCGVCRDWLPVFRELSELYPQLHFAWIDVEDEDEAMGDVEVETFPTLLIAHGKVPRFFGPVQPSAQQVARLVQTLQAQAEPEHGLQEPRIGALVERLAPLLPGAAL